MTDIIETNETALPFTKEKIDQLCMEGSNIKTALGTGIAVITAVSALDGMNKIAVSAQIGSAVGCAIAFRKHEVKDTKDYILKTILPTAVIVTAVGILAKKYFG